jgi:hypothetical protein
MAIVFDVVGAEVVLKDVVGHVAGHCEQEVVSTRERLVSGWVNSLVFRIDPV